MSDLCLFENNTMKIYPILVSSSAETPVCGDRTTFACVYIVPGIDCPRDPQQQHPTKDPVDNQFQGKLLTSISLLFSE